MTLFDSRRRRAISRSISTTISGNSFISLLMFSLFNATSWTSSTATAEATRRDDRRKESPPMQPRLRFDRLGVNEKKQRGCGQEDFDVFS